ncbi:MAG: TIM barrel protein [Treponema sp.]|jgi:hydroxypyruvate isomerase|nr:TIM barrel protein [Treponema sp.]
MQFSVCIDALFRGRSQEEALEALKAAGFQAFEFWGWWDRNLDDLCAKARALGLSCAALCTRFISLTDPAQRNAYLAGLGETIEAAKKTGAKIIISQLGNDTGCRRDFQHRSIVAGLKAAVPLLEENNGITLAIEPLNGRVDHIGTYLESSDEGFEIVREVGSARVKLLFDIYHQQISEGDIISRIGANINSIAHVHAAGVPGRHELDQGELNYPAIFKVLDQKGYRGFVGLEYFPSQDVMSGLEKLRRLDT